MKSTENQNVNPKILYAAIGAIFLLIAALTYLARNYSMDDAFIYYRYIQNAIDGNGLVYNLGERYYGITSAVYMYLSFFTASVIRDVMLNQLLLSGIFFFVCAIITLRLNLTDERLKHFAFVPAILIAGTKFFYLTFGMESTLYLMLVALTLYFYKRNKYYALSVTGAFLILTRGEAFLLLAVMLVFHFLTKKERFSLKILIIPALILLANFAFNYFYYGEILPQTFAAKMQQGDSGLWRSLPFLRVSHIIFWGDKVIFPFANGVLISIFFTIAALGAVVNFRKSDIVGILSVYIILNTIFYVALNIPGYPWYYAIYYYAAFILFAYGLLAIFDFLKKRFTKSIAISAAGFIAVITFLLLTFFSLSTLESTTVNQDYKYAGLWLEQNTPPNATVACVEIGHVGWYSKRYIIDILGLVTPYNAKFIGERKFDEWLKYYSPDYIFTHFPVWSHEQSVQKLIDNKSYVSCDDFQLDGFLILKKNINNTK